MRTILGLRSPRTLGRKVSDEFTVPLCREHHRDLHRYGNEAAWWANLQITPTAVASELWQTTLLDPDASIAHKTSSQYPTIPLDERQNSGNGISGGEGRRVDP